MSSVTHHSFQPIGLTRNSVAYLDLLRAVAANLVLFGHTSNIFGFAEDFQSGPLGVSIFFILSGFLIFLSSLNRLTRPGPYFTPYIIDRTARIFTAYVPALAIIAAANWIFSLKNWGLAGTSTGLVAFLGNLFLLQNYPIFQVGLRLFGELPKYIRPYNTAEPFWTIPIEFYIYVAFGLSFFRLVAQERIGNLIIVVLSGLAMPVVIWNAAAGGGNGLSIVWLVGATASYVWGTAWRKAHRSKTAGILFGIGACLCLAGRGQKIGWNFQDQGTAILESLVLLSSLAILEKIRPFPKFVCSMCAFLASYSYSLYLIHNTVLIVFWQEMSPILGPATMPAAVTACHIVALSVYLLFERQHRLVGRWLKRRLLRCEIPAMIVTDVSDPPGGASASC